MVDLYEFIGFVRKIRGKNANELYYCVALLCASDTNYLFRMFLERTRYLTLGLHNPTTQRVAVTRLARRSESGQAYGGAGSKRIDPFDAAFRLKTT